MQKTRSKVNVFSLNDFLVDFEINYSKPLGQGHDAYVWLVRHKQSNQLYALKCLRDQSAPKLFNLKNEILHLSNLEHPNIVNLFGYDECGTCLLIDYLPNGSFFQVLKKHKLPLPTAKGIFLQIINGVNYMHLSRIHHGDIKADNLMISSEHVVKICDFGFARQYSSGCTSVPVGGSRGYTAPEIYLNRALDDISKCDVFSCGVLFFIMVTMYPPFVSNNPNDHDSWWELLGSLRYERFWSLFEERIEVLPSEFKQLMEGMLNPNPDQRLTLVHVLEVQWLYEDAASQQQISEQLKKYLQ